MPTHRYLKTLPVALEESEVRERDRSASELAQQIAVAKADRKLAASIAKSKIDELEAEHFRLIKAANSREEPREVECRDEPDYTYGVMRTIRLDTYAQVGTRPMEPHEMQRKLRMEDDDRPGHEPQHDNGHPGDVDEAPEPASDIVEDAPDEPVLAVVIASANGTAPAVEKPQRGWLYRDHIGQEYRYMRALEGGRHIMRSCATMKQLTIDAVGFARLVHVTSLAGLQPAIPVAAEA